MFTIGEFSKITGLTVKTLRFYHEQQVLVPALVDRETGYRYYDETQIQTARTIAQLRRMEFPLTEIREILQHGQDELRLFDAIERHKEVLQRKVKNFRAALRSLERFMSDERQATNMAQNAHEVAEKLLEPTLVAGVRMKGRYSDCGKGFAMIARTLGRHVCGPPFLLHYDTEYHDDDANFEACMPIRRPTGAGDLTLREIPGGRCVALVFAGPYDQLGHSYAKLLTYIKMQKYNIAIPTREVYLKGPGMIFKGNPTNYLTEIQFLIDGGGNGS